MGFARGVFELAFPAEDCAVRKKRADGFYSPAERSTCATEMPRTMHQPHTHTRRVGHPDSLPSCRLGYPPFPKRARALALFPAAGDLHQKTRYLRPLWIGYLERCHPSSIADPSIRAVLEK